MRKKILNIIRGYENQLSNAEIANDKKQVEFLKQQIEIGNKELIKITYSNE